MFDYPSFFIARYWVLVCLAHGASNLNHCTVIHSDKDYITITWLFSFSFVCGVHHSFFYSCCLSFVGCLCSVIVACFEYRLQTIIEPASVAQLYAPSDWTPGGRGFNPRRGRQHSFVGIDHEIFSTVILSLPLIKEGQLSVSVERMCTILVNCLED